MDATSSPLTPALFRAYLRLPAQSRAASDALANVWWAQFNSVWLQVSQNYARERKSSLLGRRRQSPYHNAREPIWSANHGQPASCRHELTELLATKPRSLDGAKRVCAACGVEVR